MNQYGIQFTLFLYSVNIYTVTISFSVFRCATMTKGYRTYGQSYKESKFQSLVFCAHPLYPRSPLLCASK